MRSALPDAAQTRFRQVANGRLAAGDSDASAIRQGWYAVKQGWEKSEDGGWVRKELDEELDEDFEDFDVEKADQPRVPAGSEAGGQFAPAGGGGGGGGGSSDPWAGAREKNEFQYSQRLVNGRIKNAIGSLRGGDMQRGMASKLRDDFSGKVKDAASAGKLRDWAAAREQWATKNKLTDLASTMGGLRYAADRLVQAYGMKKMTDEFSHVRVAKVSEELGLDYGKIPVVKLDEEQRMVWGWASVSTIKNDLLFDLQKDSIEPFDLVKMATDFMEAVRTAKRMHAGDPVGMVIHSLPVTKELSDILGFGCEQEGWVVGVKIYDDQTWAAVKSGELCAFSIGGRADRVLV